MSQLTTLKSLLGVVPESDDVLQFYLDTAGNIICDRRNSNIVETIYLNLQIQIAIDLFNKRGAEGQTGHSENGIGRTFESADVSPSLLNQVTQMAKTPFSSVRVIQQ